MLSAVCTQISQPASQVRELKQGSKIGTAEVGFGGEAAGFEEH